MQWPLIWQKPPYVSQPRQVPNYISGETNNQYGADTNHIAAPLLKNESDN